MPKRFTKVLHVLEASYYTLHSSCWEDYFVVLQGLCDLPKCPIHWKPSMTQLWMNNNQVTKFQPLIYFDLGCEF
jgi:hypothetical protein